MATLTTMYAPQANTPENSITADITENETHISVLNGAALPAAPNLLTLGADTTSAETVLMTAKNNNTITVQRGHDGTTALAWPNGTLIGRYFCAADQKTLQDNIHALNSDVESRAKKATSVAATVATNNWINGENIVAVAGVIGTGANGKGSNGFVGLAQSASPEQLAATKLAEFSVVGQADGSVTLKASGTVPEIDIPITVTLFGDGGSLLAMFPAGSDTAAVAALREQVSTLLAELTENPDYAATAEVVDIRTSYDGTTYPTAGDAVRALGADIQDVEGVIALLKEALAGKVDGAYVEDGYLYMTSGDDIVVGPLGPFSGTGGGGTPSVGSVLKLTSKMASRSFSVMDTAEKVEISYNWTSYDSEDDSATGNGTASWYVGGVRVAMHTVAQGDNTFDVKSYLSVGTVNTVKLTIEDSYGATKSITWSVTVSSYGLTWNVAEMALHGSSALGLRLVPTGDGNKIIHVTVDGTEKCGETVATTGRTLAVSIDAQTHGAHVIEAWIETTVNGETLTTPHLRHVGIWVESDNTAPIVAFYKSADSVAQYATVNNQWMAYSPASEEVEVQRKVGNALESTVTASRGVQTWAYRAMTSGSITLKLVCGAVTAEKTLTVGSIGYDIAPVTSGLVLDLDPTDHSNTEAGRANFGYKDGSGTAHPLTFSENFDWDNGGFRTDDDGVTAFVVRRGTYVEFDRSLFNDNAGTAGKEIKLVFKSMNVRNYDAELLRCKAGNVGIVLQAQQATLTSELTTIVSPYCEERKIEMDINVHATNDGAFACIWLGGKPARVMNYTSADSWQQSVPSALRIGSDDCDVWIYRIKMYSNALSRFEVLDNFIADTADPAEMIARYERNDIFSTSGAIDRVKLGQKNPNLRVIRIIAQKMTTAKTDNVTADIEHTMVNGGVEDNFSAKDITFKGQGTSSAEYGLAALNMDFDLSKASEWIDSNGDAMTEYAMTEKSLPVAYFNFKANVASSENANNVCNADDYNNFNPTKVAARAADSRVRDTVEGHPAVVFFTNAADAAITVGSRTVQPGETILYASGDLNNSKKNFAVFGQNNATYAQQCCVEVMNNNNPQCLFKSDDLSTETWDGGNFEFRFPKKPTAAMKAAWQKVLSWVVSTDRTAATNAVLNPNVVYDGVTYTNDTAAYRAAKFRNEFEDYFSKKNMLFHYLFTERHLMVDNRAKNVFFSYEQDPDYSGAYRWNVCKDYDNDTADGNDNSGGLTFTYGLEDTDSIGASKVFNASDSVLWCNIRDLMFDDLANLYKELEGSGAWSATRYCKKFKDYQSARPEALVAEDMYNKYLLPYLNKGETRYLSMMYGDKQEQREQFERYQEAYIASKYGGALASADRISLRTNTPEEWTGVVPSGNLVITPYADIYVTVKYGNAGTVRKRAKRGVATTVECPTTTLNDTETYIYSSSMLTDIGDLSALYTKLAELTTASKLQKLRLGSSAVGYVNSTFGSGEGNLSFGTNALLEHVDIRGLSNLKTAQDLSSLISLTEFYASGSGITGVTFAVGAPIKNAALPAITSLTARGLINIETFSIDASALQVIWIENSPSIDVGAILESTSSIVRGRLTNVALNLATPDAVMRLVDCAGISAEGAIVENFVLTGTAYFTVITQAELDAIEAAFPDLTVTYGSIVSAHTVNFYVSDGTTSTLLYTETVRHGGNAINPVTAGLIAEPTKPSTVQHNYRYTGWDTSLENVTTDLNIYAVFATSVRKYTVSFWSGTTLMQRTAVDCYGSVRYTGASPTAPEGTVWGGWDTLTINVQSDLDVRAVFISPTLPSSVPTEYDYLYSDDPADNSAFTFSEFWGIIKNGMAQDYFTVGDKIKICPNAEAFSDTSIVLQVEAFNHYKMASGTKMADVFFGMVGIMNQKYQMNSSNVNADGWGASKMRTYLNDTIFPDLPQNWKAVISLVQVPSSKGSQSATIVTSNDKLFLRAYAECFSDGKTAVPYKDEIDADADAISISLYTDNTSRVKKMYNGTGTAECWWLRSPAADSAAIFRNVYNSGIAISSNASNSNGVSFGFCIGS